MSTETSLNYGDSGESQELQHNPAKDFEIIVNSRLRKVKHSRVTFDQVVELAFPGPHDPNVVFSMTYSHADSKPHEGNLGAGGVVEVKKQGTIFNVTRTVRS